MLQIITPAISPVYNNSPGYGILELEINTTINNTSYKLQIKDYTARFLQLMDYQQFGVQTYDEYNIQKKTGVNLNDSDTITDFHEGLYYNSQRNVATVLNANGMKEIINQGAQFLWPFGNYDKDTLYENVAYVCAKLYSDPSVQFPDYCLQACPNVVPAEITELIL